MTTTAIIAIAIAVNILAAEMFLRFLRTPRGQRFWLPQPPEPETRNQKHGTRNPEPGTKKGRPQRVSEKKSVGHQQPTQAIGQTPAAPTASPSTTLNNQ